MYAQDAMYAQPNSVEQALDLLCDNSRGASDSTNTVEPWTILAGGTDFYPSSFERQGAKRVLDVSQLKQLKRIDTVDARIRIGASVTWSDIVKADLPPAFNALKLAALEIGSVQIQNKGTLVGNLCNASPAADGVPPLLILDAMVELSSAQGVRELPLSSFILGNRHTARRQDELVTAISIPEESTTGYSTFVKLGARKYLVISISMIAARLSCNEQGQITQAAISVGSCALVAQRLTELEQLLLTQHIDVNLADLVTPEHIACLAPIDDVRSTAVYRQSATLALVQRSLTAIGHALA